MALIHCLELITDRRTIIFNINGNNGINTIIVTISCFHTEFERQRVIVISCIRVIQRTKKIEGIITIRLYH